MSQRWGVNTCPTSPIGGGFVTHPDAPATKRCPSCDETKPSARFSKHQNRADGLQSVCKDCELVYRRRTQRASDLRRNFHMTLDDWDAMLASQGGGCAICGGDDGLGVDHDQSCCPSPDKKNARACGDCNRGILCRRCNTMLGTYREDRVDLRARGWHSAVAYLERGARRREQVAS